MSKPRTIKKYPNRRLYDTEQSCYITLANLKKLIAEGINFEVRDANSNDDLTRSILLQIIAEQENEGKPLFSTEALMKMVRFYGNETQDVFSNYLSQSLDLFVQQQNQYQEKLGSMMAKDPVSAMTEMTKRNLEIWQEVQDSFMKSAGMGGGSKKSK